MAALSENDRASAWAEYMRTGDGATGITKAQLRAVVDAIDDWIDVNSTGFNNAIPQPQRGLLSTKQKVSIFMRVLRFRYLVT